MPLATPNASRLRRRHKNEQQFCQSRLFISGVPAIKVCDIVRPIVSTIAGLFVPWNIRTLIYITCGVLTAPRIHE